MNEKERAERDEWIEAFFETCADDIDEQCIDMVVKYFAKRKAMRIIEELSLGEIDV